MDHKPANDALQFSRRLEVETPEHVVLQFELADVGSRTAAAVVDWAILIGVLMGLFIVFGGIGLFELLRGWALALLIALGFLITWGYFALFEGLSAGRTPGKRSLGLRVVMDTGHPVTLSAALIRNLVRIADMQPGVSYLVGLIFVFFHPEHRRLGDLAASTIVVRDHPPSEKMPRAVAEETIEHLAVAGQPRLTDDEFRLLQQLLERLESLDPAARIRLTDRLADKFTDRFHRRQADPEVFLVAVHDEELERRRSVTAVRRREGAGRVSGSAERFVALRRASWDRFQVQAERAVKEGLRGRSGAAVREFAAAYREVAADLARARTYGVDARVFRHLERIVATGHNALYGSRGVRRFSPRRLLLADLPASVVQERRYVIAAFLLFIAPAFIGFTVVRSAPERAYELLPHGVIERAESGIAEAEEGIGYAETPSLYLPVVASSIIANNVQVAFMAFAFGVTAGVGTVIVLAFNGLFLGAVLALFTNYGLAAWLLTFVAGHGPLELTAIFIAGGAGLRIGRSIVAPGDLARRDALVLAARAALRLVGAAASLLLLAGLIEGFLSASAAPMAIKLGVSAASVLLLVLYLEAGRRSRRALPWSRSAT